MCITHVQPHRKAIIDNSDVTGGVHNSSSSLALILQHDFWGNPIEHSGSHKSFRPLTVLYFRALVRLFGLHATVFHAANLLLYGICCCLIYRLLSLLLFRDGRSSSAASSSAGPLVGTLFFAVHPVCTVDGVVYRGSR